MNPQDITDVEEQLNSEVRHHVLLCANCNETTVNLDDRIVETMCGRVVRYRQPPTWCEDCVEILKVSDSGVCALCGVTVTKIIRKY